MIALLVVLCASLALAQRTPPMPGQLVMVNARELHVDCRGKGPSVVFVNGIPRFSMDWLLVQQEVAKFARACTWDRASEAWSGTGWSYDAEVAVSDLDQIAKYADATAPVILVAHSAGGSVSRIFASRHPARVRALILVDAVPNNGETMASITEEQIAQAVEQVLNRPRQEPPPIEAALKKLPDHAQTSHTWAASRWFLDQGANVLEGMNYQRDIGKALLGASRKPKRLGAMRLIVIARAASADDEGDWIKQQRKLLEWSTNATLIRAVGSSHDIEVDDPAIIVTAIRSALAK